MAGTDYIIRRHEDNGEECLDWKTEGSRVLGRKIMRWNVQIRQIYMAATYIQIEQINTSCAHDLL